MTQNEKAIAALFFKSGYTGDFSRVEWFNSNCRICPLNESSELSRDDDEATCTTARIVPLAQGVISAIWHIGEDAKIGARNVARRYVPTCFGVGKKLNIYPLPTQPGNQGRFYWPGEMVKVDVEDKS